MKVSNIIEAVVYSIVDWVLNHFAFVLGMIGAGTILLLIFIFT